MIIFMEHQAPVVATVLIYAARMIELATKRRTVPGERQESLTLKLFILCGVIMAAGGIGEYYLRDLQFWWPTFFGGLAISIAAFAIRWSAIRALGRFWSLHVEMREGHEFIRSGPFERVRHPAYLSMILEHVGIAVLLGSWIAFSITMLVFVPTLRARLMREEAALIRKFGPAYEEYRAATPAILPFR